MKSHKRGYQVGTKLDKSFSSLDVARSQIGSFIVNAKATLYKKIDILTCLWPLVANKNHHRFSLSLAQREDRSAVFLPTRPCRRTLANLLE